MPKITRLIEIQSYLQTHFDDKLGKGKIKIITHSKSVDESALDTENFAHIQITIVKPIDDPKLPPVKRSSHYDKNNNFSKHLFFIILFFLLINFF